MSLRVTILSSFSLWTTKLKRDKNKCRKKTCNKVKTNQRGTTRADGHSVPLVWRADRLGSWEVLIPPPPPPPNPCGILINHWVTASSMTDLRIPQWLECQWHRSQYRIRTDFWIQNSSLLPDNNFFFQTKVRWSTKILRMQDQSFFHCTLQTYGLVWMNNIRAKRNKFTSKALVVTLKKKLTCIINHFSRLFLHFPDFFQVWKIAGQISWLFQKFKTLYEPCQ